MPPSRIATFNVEHLNEAAAADGTDADAFAASIYGR